MKVYSSLPAVYAEHFLWVQHLLDLSVLHQVQREDDSTKMSRITSEYGARCTRSGVALFSRSLQCVAIRCLDFRGTARASESIVYSLVRSPF